MRAWLAIACAVASFCVGAREVVVVAEQGACKTSVAGLDVDATWDLELPVWMEGVEGKQVKALRAFLYNLAFAHEPSRAKAEEPAGVSMQEHIARKIQDVKAFGEPSLTMGALTLRARVRLAFAGAKYVGVDYTGYYNEGGNGCHETVWKGVLALPSWQELRLGEMLRPGVQRSFAVWLATRIAREQKLDYAPWEPTAGAEVTLPFFLPYKDGVQFTFAPYSYFPGVCGVTETKVPWEELKPWLRDEALRELKTLKEDTP